MNINLYGTYSQGSLFFSSNSLEDYFYHEPLNISVAETNLRFHFSSNISDEIFKSMKVTTFWNASLEGLLYFPIPNGIENLSLFAHNQYIFNYPIKIPASVKYMDDAFSASNADYYHRFNSPLEFLGNNVISVDNFMNNCKMYSYGVTLPEGVIRMDNAFSGCSNIKNIYVPDSVVIIGDNCFYGCNYSARVNLPAHFYCTYSEQDRRNAFTNRFSNVVFRPFPSSWDTEFGLFFKSNNTMFMSWNNMYKNNIWYWTYDNSEGFHTNISALNTAISQRFGQFYMVIPNFSAIGNLLGPINGVNSMTVYLSEGTKYGPMRFWFSGSPSYYEVHFPSTIKDFGEYLTNMNLYQNNVNNIFLHPNTKHLDSLFKRVFFKQDMETCFRNFSFPQNLLSINYLFYYATFGDWYNGIRYPVFYMKNLPNSIEYMENTFETNNRVTMTSIKGFTNNTMELPTNLISMRNCFANFSINGAKLIINIPQNVIDMSGAFYNGGLINYLTISCIPNCHKLKLLCNTFQSTGFDKSVNITIPNSVISMNNCFRSCSTNNSTIQLSKSVKFARGAFAGCYNVNIIIPPDSELISMTEILNQAVYSNISAINIPEKVVMFHDAFNNCRTLKTVHFYSKFSFKNQFIRENLYKNAFCNCNYLTDIYYYQNLENIGFPVQLFSTLNNSSVIRNLHVFKNINLNGGNRSFLYPGGYKLNIQSNYLNYGNFRSIVINDIE